MGQQEIHLPAQGCLVPAGLAVRSKEVLSGPSKLLQVSKEYCFAFAWFLEWVGFTCSNL